MTPNVSPEVYESLCPALCTRILPISEWHPPLPSIKNNVVKKHAWQRTLDNHCPGWTKLQLFGLQQYETILYIDSDCLVLKDVSSLLELNKVYTDSQALIAAAPDLLPPHYFNSGVMVVRPSTQVMESMKHHAKLLTRLDESDTGFLNDFFPTWNTESPPFARLPVGYNAQEAMYDMTVETSGESSFWSVQVASDLYIVHYSNVKKPWEENSGHDLQTLWKTWYRKSKNYLLRMRKEEQEQSKRTARPQQEIPTNEEDRRKKIGKRMQSLIAQGKSIEEATHQACVEYGENPMSQPQTKLGNSGQIHRLIARRFKELRAQGASSADAMLQARSEFGQGHEEEINPSTQVAAMFGIR